ncbi:MAG: hypothetical protein ACYC1C_08155 [Chloroflexota bacterium]
MGEDSECRQAAPPPGLVDRYELPLRPGALRSLYQLEIGLYDARTMERLPVFTSAGEDKENRVILTELGVAQ